MFGIFKKKTPETRPQYSFETDEFKRKEAAGIAIAQERSQQRAGKEAHEARVAQVALEQSRAQQETAEVEEIKQKINAQP